MCVFFFIYAKFSHRISPYGMRRAGAKTRRVINIIASGLKPLSLGGCGGGGGGCGFAPMTLAQMNC